MNGRIAVLCPTRDHWQGFCRLAGNLAETSNQADLLGYVDDDQFEVYQHQCEQQPWSARSRMTLVRGPRIGPVAAANQLAASYPEYELYGFVPDDAVFKAPGWDRWCLSALDAFPNRVGMISPAHSLGRHVDMPFVTNAWIHATGWFAHPATYHYAWPIINGLIGEMTAILHASEQGFMVDHDGRLPANQGKRTLDAEVFMTFVANELPEVVERVRNAMRGGLD